MTPIATPIVTDARTQSRARWLMLALGSAVGAFFAISAVVLAYKIHAAGELVDPAYEKACRYPKRIGEVTVAVRDEDGKLKCWVMGS